jgi:hypothetical protein
VRLRPLSLSAQPSHRRAAPAAGQVVAQGVAQAAPPEPRELPPPEEVQVHSSRALPVIAPPERAPPHRVERPHRETLETRALGAPTPPQRLVRKAALQARAARLSSGVGHDASRASALAALDNFVATLGYARPSERAKALRHAW